MTDPTNDTEPTPYDYSKFGFLAVHRGIQYELGNAPNGTAWEHDLWELRVPFTRPVPKLHDYEQYPALARNNRGDEFMHKEQLRELGWTTFEYRTGMGLRAKTKRYIVNGQWAETKPVKPTIKDLLNSTLRDFQGETFDEWCDTFGYSNDSIKALDIYRKCQENYTKICKCIPVTEHAAILDDLQDY